MKRNIFVLISLLFSALSYSQVGINTENPKAALHVNGDVILKDAPSNTDGSAKPLILMPDNKVGYTPMLSARHLIINSSVQQTFIGAYLNDGDIMPVTWNTQADSLFNNLLTINNDHTFTFDEDVVCEISGYINYCPRATIPIFVSDESNTQLAALSASIQYREAGKTAEADWISLTFAIQSWFKVEVNSQYKTVQIPSAVRSFKKGDQVRMTVARPSYISGGGSFFLGMKHCQNSGANVGVPPGSQFSKGMKIIAL